MFSAEPEEDPMNLESSELFHVWNHCHACGAKPIVGRRFECLTCSAGPSNDLCERCYRLFEAGQVQHPDPEAINSLTARTPHLFRAVEGRYSNRDCLPWLTVSHPVAPSPLVPDRFLVRPEFRSKRESCFGAYAFVVESESRERFVLTALHVLDELIKREGIDCSSKNSTYTGEELPRIVEEVRLYDAYAAKWMLSQLGVARSMLILPHARIGEEEPYSQQDIAAFRPDPSSILFYGRLAESPSGVGHPMWLAVRLPDGSSRTIAAVVVELTERTLIFRYEDAVLVPRFTSGAPLLNRQGQVVGINVGGGSVGGYRVGHAHHVTSVRRHLGMPWSPVKGSTSGALSDQAANG